MSEIIQSQEGMEQWLHQLDNPHHPLMKMGLLERTKPKFLGCDFIKKEADFSLLVEDWQLDAPGNVHTGLITAAFDTVFGLLCHFFAKGHMVCTMQLSTAYLQPMPPDKDVVYHVKALSVGKNIVTLRGEAHLAEDETTVFATADTTFMILHSIFQK